MLTAFVLILAFLALSCSKYPEKASESELAVHFSHRVGPEKLELNSAHYSNAADNLYEVTRLEYIVSGFFLISEHGRKVRLDTVLYMNAKSEGEVLFEGIPAGTYLRAGFTFGLAPEKNRSRAYRDRKEMAEMAWPEQMGGGYHFMRFEGRYKDSSEWKGFALHLGKDGNHVEVSERVHLELDDGNGEVRVSMDLNDWFEGEGGLYDLESDPAYSMSNDRAMRRLAENGKSALKIGASP
jgi:hypothetical protein